MIMWPEFIWRWTEGWKFKNVEPSELFLKTVRVNGIVVIISALFFSFLLLFWE
ncbi:MAG: hypothetical protein JEZ00_09145 [Anaerolineaceae bacterium]|nr:hypothetical protein [Anaerolineaceae bacterium]